MVKAGFTLIDFDAKGLDKTLKSLDQLSDKSRKAEKEANQLTKQFSELNKDLTGASSTNTALDQLGVGLASVRGDLTSIGDLGRKVASGISSAFGSAFDKLLVSGKDFKSVLKGLESDLLRIGSRAITSQISQSVSGQDGVLGQLGGALFSGGQGLLSNLFSGYATGGEFTVGGAAGVDRNLVGLRLTRGEKVTVETAAQQRQAALAPAAAPHITMAFNIATPDADSFRRSQSQIQGEALRQAQRMLKRNG